MYCWKQIPLRKQLKIVAKVQPELSITIPSKIVHWDHLTFSQLYCSWWLIIIMSDHNFCMSEHGVKEKQVRLLRKEDCFGNKETIDTVFNFCIHVYACFILT